MAAATAYAEGSIPTPSSKSTPATRSSGKRKRDASPAVPARSAPSARRSAQTNAVSNGDNFDDTQNSGFDLSALQSNQASPTRGTRPQPNPGPNIDTAAAALNYGMDASGSGFQLQPPEGSSDFHLQNQASNGTHSNGPASPSGPIQDARAEGSQSPSLEAQPSNPLSANSLKPAVGSNEWHKVRKDNHKEVERRRRETINEGINEIAKIVPGCEKNKGSILQRAVQYIQKLQDDAQANIDKWTFEKLVTEQAINDLSGKLERLQREREGYRKAAEEGGVDVEMVARSFAEEGEAEESGK